MFDTYVLNEPGEKAVVALKSGIASAVKQVAQALPDGPEKALFTAKLEEAVFLGTKAIASVPGNSEKVTRY